MLMVITTVHIKDGGKCWTR